MEPTMQAESSSLAVDQGDHGENKLTLQGFPRQKLFLLTGDLGSILAAGIVISLSATGSVAAISSLLTILVVSVVCYPAALYVFDMYNAERSFRHGDVVKRCLFAILLGGAVSIPLSAVIGEHAIIRGQPLHMAMLLALFAGCRYAYSTLWQTIFVKKVVLIVGAGAPGLAIYNILRSPASPYTVKGFVDDDRASAARVHPKIVGTTDRVTEVAGNLGAASVILAIPGDRSPRLTRSILQARLQGTVIEEMVDVYERLTGRVPVEHIRDEWLLSAEGFDILHKAYIRRVKRFLDLMISGFLLLLTGPATLLTGLLVHLDSTGPVFYTQERVGKNGKVFKLFKFRSMRVDAESQGAQWAAGDDPRVTCVGKWLRLYRIDELPQLWNVVRGDMSLVGPRPERPEFVRLLEQRIPYYSLRHYVTPGITGWAQVTFRYASSVEDALNKLEADVYYIKNMSLILDLKIILKTIGVVFLAQGSR
jgi:sugar transferase (PEP-CTERM system associated)